MTTYAPTANPGDERTRCRFFGAVLPHNGLPQIQVIEESVIRRADGTEKPIADLGNLRVGVFDPAETFALRDPTTDALTGQTASVSEAFALIYSWVRHKQTQRDEAATTATITVK
jgi:hypothetical protein